MQRMKVNMYAIAAAMIRGPRKRQRGATAAEYALIIAIVATAIIFAFTLFGNTLRNIMNVFAGNARIT